MQAGRRGIRRGRPALGQSPVDRRRRGANRWVGGRPFLARNARDLPLPLRVLARQPELVPQMAEARGVHGAAVEQQLAERGAPDIFGWPTVYITLNGRPEFRGRRSIANSAPASHYRGSLKPMRAKRWPWRLQLIRRLRCESTTNPSTLLPSPPPVPERRRLRKMH
jgi:hypothetical protein